MRVDDLRAKEERAESYTSEEEYMERERESSVEWEGEMRVFTIVTREWGGQSKS